LSTNACHLLGSMLRYIKYIFLFIEMHFLMLELWVIPKGAQCNFRSLVWASEYVVTLSCIFMLDVLQCLLDYVGANLD
jgi:hypothetical protein